MQKKFRGSSRMLLVLAASGSLALTGCFDSDSSSGSSSSSNNGSNSGLDLHPSAPVVAQGGVLQLMTELRGSSGEVIEYTEDQSFDVSWEVADTQVATIDETGRLRGVSSGLGSTQVTATITQYSVPENEDDEREKLKSWTQSADVRVEVVDTVRLFANPRVLTLGMNETAEVVLTGLDDQNFPTNLERERVSFSTDSYYLDVQRNFSDQRNAVEVGSKGQRGYTFVTPEYNYESLTITGDPLLVQIQPTPQPNQPSGARGGEHVDFGFSRIGSAEYMHAVHSGMERLHYQRFSTETGSWSYPAISSEYVEFNRLLVDGSDIHLFGLINGNLTWFFSDDNGGSFRDGRVIANEAINSGDLLRAVIHDGTPWLLYQNGSGDLKLVEVRGNDDYQTFDLGRKNAKALDLVSSQNQLSLAYANSEGVYYVSKNGNSFLREQASSRDASKISLNFSRAQVPHIAIYANESITLQRRAGNNDWAGPTFDDVTFSEAAGSENGTTWGFRPLDQVHSLDLAFDLYDAATLVIADDDRVYYAKRLELGQDSYWRIEQVVDEQAGESAAMAIDHRNRLRVFYQDMENDWIKFWAEPIFFDYRERTPRITGASATLDQGAVGVECFKGCEESLEAAN